MQSQPHTHQEICQKAIIYKKETSRPLTDYQKQVNKCSQDIAIRDPMLLTNRGKLLEAAKEAVHESGYCFKKGYSQSKRLSKDCSKEPVKRAKINKELRDQRIRDLTDQINDFKQRISFKEKRIAAAETMKNYKVCDEITGELSDIKGKCRELESELKLLLSKEKRAKKYKKNVSTDSSSVVSEVESSLSADHQRNVDIRTYLPTKVVAESHTDTMDQTDSEDETDTVDLTDLVDSQNSIEDSATSKDVHPF